jgi:hypothetical protein
MGVTLPRIIYVEEVVSPVVLTTHGLEYIEQIPFFG